MITDGPAIPQTLDEAIAKIPRSYEVTVRRKENDKGWWMCAERGQNGGEFRVSSQSQPTWQEAFAVIWSKI